MVSISNKAAAMLREQLINKFFETDIGFRILVSDNEPGRENLSIKIDRQKQSDKIIDSSGVKVFLDPICADRISAYQLDYHDGPNSGFFLSTKKETKSGKNQSKRTVSEA
jgi:Fe-S cluster assembly iron-binding protein IscA